MDSPPPSAPPYSRPSAESQSLIKLASPVLAPASDADRNEAHNENQIVPFLVATPPPPRKRSPLSPSPLHLSPVIAPFPFQELANPSRCSAHHTHRHKWRAAAEEGPEAGAASRRRGKTRAAAAAAMGLMGCASSPRNARRARRRLEKDILREEREMTLPEDGDAGRGRKGRQNRSKGFNTERLSLAPVVASLSPPAAAATPGTDTGEDVDINGDIGGGLDRLQDQIVELVMWRNVAKSTLWFGLGCLLFLSSCFSKDLGFSMISAMSHVGLVVLGLAFFMDSVPLRQQKKMASKLKITEDDILRATQVILPVANAAIAKTQEIFRGDPLRTLQVAPALLFGASYGHLITPRTLFSTCFFVSFTLPKLYSCYSHQIHNKAVSMLNRVQEAWESCPRKKLVAASAAAMFWNLFSVKSRVFAVLISLVIIRYHHQQIEKNNGMTEWVEVEQQVLPSEQVQH